MIFSVEMFHKIPQNNQHYKNPYGVRDLNLHYQLHFDPKLGHGKCTIRHIPGEFMHVQISCICLVTQHFMLENNQAVRFQNIVSNPMYWVS